MTTANVGLIGLAVMGQNLVLNMERNGFTVAVYNRTTAVTDDFVASHPGKGLVAARTLQEFVDSLERPRRILIMVKAGAAVDAVIDGLLPLLDPGDLIMDGGNSYFQDTERRSQILTARRLSVHGRGRQRRRRRCFVGSQHNAGRCARRVGHGRRSASGDRRKSARRWQALCGLPRARAVLATMSKWSTTGSNTATCS